VKVSAVTPLPAAANPQHPDHARWVKDQTLKIEMNHVRSVGGSARDAETNNMRALERLANRKQRPQAKKKTKKIDTAEQLAKQGVTQRVAPVKNLPPLPLCKLCGHCVRCKRELRMSQIMTKARQQDPKALQLLTELVAIGFAANARKDYKDALGRELPFSRLKGHDLNRAVTAGADWVCDRSVSFMGQWR
jgi:hypothetical protein